MKRLRAWILAAFMLPGSAFAQDTVALTAPQLRNVMAAQMARGDLAGAATLAKALLARDAQDAQALATLGQISAQTGNAAYARGYGLAAFSAADDAPGRYVGARLAALGYAMEGRGLRSQFWLRRAAQSAPDDAARNSVARDYRIARAASPWSVQLRGTVSPSSNVNSGTSSATSTVVILGRPVTLPLPGNFRALSGTTFNTSAQLRYRLSGTRQAATYLSAGLSLHRVRLSDEARVQAPTATDADYASTGLSFGLSHNRRLGDWMLAVDGEALRQWRASRIAADHLALQLRVQRDLGKGRIGFGLSHRWIWHNSGDTQRTRSVSADWSAPLGDAARLSLSGRLERTDASQAKLARDAQSISIGMDLTHPVIGALWGVDLSRDWRSYDNTLSERTDTLRVTATVPDIEFYGFVPRITAEHYHTDASQDVFKSEGLDVGLSFTSAF